MHIAILGIALAAQTPSPVSEPYHASGREPSAWSLTIADGQMRFESTGRDPISVPSPRARTSAEGAEYRSSRIEAHIMHGPPVCEGADDLSFRDSVFVTVGRTEYSGCGGAPLPIDWLDGTSWHFTEIAGENTNLTGDLLRDDRYAIDFGADSMVGYGGCNRFSAGYSREGDTLTTRAPYGATRGACSEAVTNRERRLFQILVQPMRIGFPDRNTMTWTNDGGTVRLVRSRAR